MRRFRSESVEKAGCQRRDSTLLGCGDGAQNIAGIGDAVVLGATGTAEHPEMQSTRLLINCGFYRLKENSGGLAVRTPLEIHEHRSTH
jgi:hypothetical protein